MHSGLESILGLLTKGRNINQKNYLSKGEKVVILKV